MLGAGEISSLLRVFSRASLLALAFYSLSCSWVDLVTMFVRPLRPLRS